MSSNNKVFISVENAIKESRHECGHIPDFSLEKKTFNVFRISKDESGLSKYYFTCRGNFKSDYEMKKIRGSIILDEDFNIKQCRRGHMKFEIDDSHDLICLTDDEMKKLAD